MGFSQATITAGPTLARSGTELLVTWASSSPTGTVFQIYVDRALVWSGAASRALLPWPAAAVRVDVGTVGPTEGRVDFAADLPAGPQDTVALAWDGGLWEGADIAGYYIYMSPTPGAAIDFTRPAATVPFTTQGLTYGGFGQGGFGRGGFGAGQYPHFTWTSGHLAGGVWQFAVAPFDTAGNVQPAPLTATVTVVAPPAPPAPNAAGQRLTYTLAADGAPTLHWRASPSA